MSASHPLLSSIEDARFQREFLRLRQDDLAARTDDAGTAFALKLHYAVDANVFDLFCNPRGKAEDLARRIGAGAVFRSDSTDRMTSIAASIASYLFYRLTADRPLIVLLPVNEEIARIVSFHAEQASLRINKTHDRLKTRVEQAMASDGRIDEAELKDIRDALLVDGSHKAMIRRIENVLQQGRLGSANVLSDACLIDQILCDALMPTLGREERSNYFRISAAWDAALKKARGPKKKRPVWEVDVEALTRLTLANDRLRQWTGDRERLLYLTMDAQLFEAGEVFYEELGRIEESTFSERYLRHPRSYLDEEGVLLPPRAGEPAGDAPKDWLTLIDWFDLLLGHVKDEGSRSSKGATAANAHRPRTYSIEDRRHTDSEALLRTISSWEESRYRELLEFGNRWGEYQAAQSYDLPDPLLKTIEDKLDGDYAGFVGSLRELLEQINKEQSDAWDRLFKLNVEARFLLQSAGENQRARHVPMLFFEGHPVFEEFTKWVKAWQNSPEIRDDDKYIRLRGALLKEDRSGYGYYLAHSYLLALDGQWASAAILATRAREVSVGFRTGSPDGANGREAAFFEAHCRRRAGTDVAQLEELSALVHEAKEILRAETDDARKMGKHHDVVDERYDAELLAIELTRALLDWSGAPVEEKNAALERTADFVDSYWALYESAGRHLRALAPQGANNAYRTELLVQLTKRALCNIAAIGIQVESARSSAQRAWHTLKDIGPSQLRNHFATFVYHCCECLFDERPVRVLEAKAIVQKLSAPRMLERNRVFDYDNDRYKDMRAKALAR